MKKLKDEYYQNVAYNYSFQIVAMALGMLSTRITLDYLGTTLYGLWVTIASVISWMNSGDFGIGNGLRNELAKAYGQKDEQKQTILVQVAFKSIRRIAVLLFIIILALSEVLIRTGLLEQSLRMPMYITGAFFCINLCLKMVDSIAYAYQKSALVSCKGCLISVCSILLVGFLDQSGIQADLSLFAFVNGLCIMIPNLLLVILLKHKGVMQTSIKQYSNDEQPVLKSIMNTGMKFFGLQICGVILYSTDNLIINYCLTSEMVTKYSSITKIYDMGSSIFSILLIALWSAVTLHIAQNDFGWIRKKIKELLLIWSFFCVGVIAVSLMFNPIVKIWLGKNAFHYEPALIILFALYCMTTTFSSIFVNVMNGAGVIKLQLGLAIFGAVINIPLSVFFATTLGMGIFGVKLATYVSAIISAIAMPIQAVKYINCH